jgi:hypothetical protein
MKKLDVIQMENVNGGGCFEGWHYSCSEHIGCLAIGLITLATVVASWAAPASYAACLTVAY